MCHDYSYQKQLVECYYFSPCEGGRAWLLFEPIWFLLNWVLQKVYFKIGNISTPDVSSLYPVDTVLLIVFLLHSFKRGDRKLFEQWYSLELTKLGGNISNHSRCILLTCILNCHISITWLQGLLFFILISPIVRFLVPYSIVSCTS